MNHAEVVLVSINRVHLDIVDRKYFKQNVSYIL